MTIRAEAEEAIESLRQLYHNTGMSLASFAATVIEELLEQKDPAPTAPLPAPLTAREYFAGQAMGGLLAAGPEALEMMLGLSRARGRDVSRSVVRIAVEQADELIRELQRPADRDPRFVDSEEVFPGAVTP